MGVIEGSATLLASRMASSRLVLQECSDTHLWICIEVDRQQVERSQRPRLCQVLGISYPGLTSYGQRTTNTDSLDWP
jgi:hypothetical protein